MNVEHAHTPPSAPAPIRRRAIALGVAGAAAICALTPANNVYHQATPLGGGHFPLAPFVCFFLLVAAMGALRRLRPAMAPLTGRELLVAWIQMVIGSGIAYTGLARTILLNLTVPFQFATPENDWRSTLLPLLPRALYPDPGAVSLLYQGLPGGAQLSWPELFARIPWQGWARPALAWGIFVALAYLVMLSLINVFSKQWNHNEHLNYPLLGVPKLLARRLDEGGLGRMLTDPYLLAGVAVPVVLHTLGGLHFYIPSVPAVPTLVLAGPYFPKHGLLSGFHKLKIYVYPAFIGFAFLSTRQLSLSFWLFFLGGGLLAGMLEVLGYRLPASALGITFGPTLTRPDEMQMIGAYGVYFCFLCYLARQHLLDVGRAGFGRVPTGAAQEGGWFSLRLAFWTATLGMAALVGWGAYFGVRPIAMAAVVAAFFMITLVATRVICQGGLAYFTLTAAPLDGLLGLFGPHFLGKTGILVSAAAQKTLFLDLRESLMPSLLHARQLHRRLQPQRRLLAGLAVTIAVSVAVSLLAMMLLCYRYGIRELPLEWATSTSISLYEKVARLHANPVTCGHQAKVFMAVGAAVMAALVFCYHRFYWWPVHPLGYLTAYSSAMRILWFSFFVGYLCNSLCMRYGGVRLFRRLQLFFMGLIIGDFLMGAIWAAIGLLTDGSYQVLPD